MVVQGLMVVRPAWLGYLGFEGAHSNKQAVSQGVLPFFHSLSRVQS